MAHPDSQTAEEPSPTGNSPDKATMLGTLVHLWPYIWPGDRADLKMRVVWSMVLLLVAKLATLSVPFTFKWAIDALNGTPSAPVEVGASSGCESVWAIGQTPKSLMAHPFAVVWFPLNFIMSVI